MGICLLPSLFLGAAVAGTGPPVPGDAFDPPGAGPMAWVPSGTFAMGAAPEEARSYPQERPRRRVRVETGFWMGIHEVTQAAYQELVGENPSRFRGPRRPVEGVSWEEARRYCRLLTARERAGDRLPEGWVYTLPSEAQWEYAARAGEGAHLPVRAVERHAWGLPWSRHETARVGTKTANAWGLHDMLGNVWEWCLDGYAPYHPRLETDDRPQGPAYSHDRVVRGGSWMNLPEDIRLTFRLAYPRFSRWDHVGFRLVLVQEERWEPEPVPEPEELAPVPCAGGPALVEGGTRVAEGIGLRLHWVPARAPDGGFWIGEREVTQAEYRAVVGENPSLRAGDQLPVERVDWADAMRFARRLGELECAAGRVPPGWSYRLPRAVEWERALELGGDRPASSNRQGTRPADEAEPDALGLRDMVGNVWEWCLDAPPGDDAASTRRSIRGGSYRFGGMKSWTRRVVADPSLGFRVVLARTEGPE